MYEISKRLGNYLTAVMAVALAWLFSAGCGSEPSYDGIGLKRWDQQLDSKDYEERVAAAQGIGHIGAYARGESDHLRDLAADDPVPAVRVAAIKALKAVGEKTVEFDEYLAEVTGPLYDTRGPGLRDLASIRSVAPESTATNSKGGGALLMDDEDLDYLTKLETPDEEETKNDWDAQAGPVEEWPYINPRSQDQVEASAGGGSAEQSNTVEAPILFRPSSGSSNGGGRGSGFQPRTGLPIGVTPSLSSVPGIGKPHSAGNTNQSGRRNPDLRRRRP